MKLFILCHWIGFLFSILILAGMTYLHKELDMVLVYLHESPDNTGTYFGWLASLIFASTLPAFSGWLMGRVVDGRRHFLPFK